MEPAPTTKKVSKSKVRLSTGLSRASPNTIENPPDLNGDKMPEVEEPPKENNKDVDMEDASKKEKDDSTKSKPAQGKKRKHDETKDITEQTSEDSNNEFHGFGAEQDPVVEKDPSPVEEKAETKPVTKTDTPQESAFGKGKRSRIPNKKYELALKSFSKLSSSHDNITDNGPVNSSEVTSSVDGKNDEDGDNQLSKGDDLSSEVTSSAHSSPSVGSRSSQKSSRLSGMASPGTPHSKKQKLAVDLTNPCYLKPFELGWKRELVYRATLDNNLKRNGDIYYYTPGGRKVRSMREVAENLKDKELTLDDFTFFKEPLGINDPDKEIIRDAKMKGGGTTTTPSTTKKVPKVKTPKEKVPSPKTATTDTPTLSPKVAKSPRLGGFKIKLSGSRLNQSSKSERKRAQTDEMEIGMLPPMWSPKKGSAGKQPGWQAKTSCNMPAVTAPMDSKPCRPCSIRCQGVSGLIPTLQCRLCLCLYHTECVGLGPADDVAQGYVCKNCQLENHDNSNASTSSAPTIAPPPLTPINSLKTNNTQSATPPKLQRIPRPGEVTITPTGPSPHKQIPKLHDTSKSDGAKVTRPSKFATVPRFVKVTDSHTVTQPESNKSIVGSVTTWFPPSSKIQMNASTSQGKNSTEEAPPPRPQTVAYIGDRKFLVVPKHNILSVSPTIAAAASTPTLRHTTSPTADKAPTSYFDGKDKSSLNLEAATANTANTSTPTAPTTPAADSDPVPLPPTLPPTTTLNSPTALADNSGPPDVVVPPAPATDETNTTPGSHLSKPRPAPHKESPTESSPKPKRTSRKPLQPPVSASIAKVDTESLFMQNYLQNVSYGYQTLLHVFQYLKVQDLLRAMRVCTVWRDIAGHPSLWRTVRMKNSQVADWEGLINALQEHKTETLDLRKMLLPNNGDDLWPLFSKAISRVDSLKRIELCRCPASVIEELAKSNPKLQVINAVTIRCEKLDLTPVDNLVNLYELRLKSTNGFTLTSDLTPLKNLTQLKHLSLTSVKELNKLNVEVIGELVNLESLDLGECSDFPENFGSDIILKLSKLEKLRLEKGQGTCCTFNILEAVSQIPSLEQLELVNFDVKAGFDKALGACTNIKKLLIIPTYISQSATTNHMVLGGVIKLKSTLSHFVWGVTLELLRVTELFVDQCEDSPNKEKKKPTGNGDSIPVLKPVPIMKTDESKDEGSSSKEPPQVEILPLPTLQKLLLTSLPKTKVKILKIPFHATWRQSFVDTVN